MALPLRKVNLLDYLAGEDSSDRKHEYYGGEVFEMEAASLNHARIARNLLVQLSASLKGTGCEVLLTPRTATGERGLYTYPDLIVVCGQLQTSPLNRDTVTNPRVIIEVLSKSTEGYDRGKKFDLYTAIPTFVEYLTVSQDAPWILHHIRHENNEWRLRHITGPEAILRFANLPVEIPLGAIYADVEFEPSAT